MRKKFTPAAPPLAATAFYPYYMPFPFFTRKDGFSAIMTPNRPKRDSFRQIAQKSGHDTQSDVVAYEIEQI